MNQELQNELKERLIADKARIEGELSQFTTKDKDGQITTDFPDDLGTERSENANEVEEYTDRLALEKSLETRLMEINDALLRMDSGAYGIDASTGEAINEDRLRAYPAARTNVTPK